MWPYRQPGLTNGANFLPSFWRAVQMLPFALRNYRGPVCSFDRQCLNARLQARLLLATCLLAFVVATSCTASKGQNLKPSPDKAWQALSGRAAERGFTGLSFKLEPLPVYALLRCSNASAKNELVVYIEGDGQALLPGGQAALDPTPVVAYAFELALPDPAPCLLYLARPGQYYQEPEKANPKYWTSARYSPETLEALNLAINQAKQLTRTSYIHLTGYSGGGTVATLLAQQRGDVLSLTSLAAVLDTDFWTKNGHYKPLTGSLNPADKLAAIKNLPQIHFAGTCDSTVPPAVFEHFSRLAHFKQMQLIYEPFDHASPLWVNKWPKLLNQYVQPMRKASSNSHN